MLENMITDRTASDVLRWRELRDKGLEEMTPAELAEWEAGMKGSYNISDLNRVGAALSYLREELMKAGYLTGVEFVPKMDWVEEDVPTRQEYDEYVRAVNVVKYVLAWYKTTPNAPPIGGRLNFKGANDIEQILLDVDELLTKTNAKPYYCGELYCGEL